MTEEQDKERREAERMAMEAERLRTDDACASAVKAARNSASDQLIATEQRLVKAVLEDTPTGEPANEVRRLQAQIAAIDALTTEIAYIIIRGKPREVKLVA